MDFELNDDQRAFQEAARAFAASEMAPHAAHWDEHAVFPRDVLRRAGELGLCGLYASQACGAGMSTGQVSVPKQDGAACDSGQRAKVFTPSSASVWRYPLLSSLKRMPSTSRKSRRSSAG